MKTCCDLLSHLCKDIALCLPNFTSATGKSGTVKIILITQILALHINQVADLLEGGVLAEHQSQNEIAF